MAYDIIAAVKREFKIAWRRKFPIENDKEFYAFESLLEKLSANNQELIDTLSTKLIRQIILIDPDTKDALKKNRQRNCQQIQSIYNYLVLM